jgi:hypothetical protein
MGQLRSVRSHSARRPPRSPCSLARQPGSRYQPALNAKGRPRMVLDPPVASARLSPLFWPDVAHARPGVRGPYRSLSQPDAQRRCPCCRRVIGGNARRGTASMAVGRLAGSGVQPYRRPAVRRVAGDQPAAGASQRTDHARCNAADGDPDRRGRSAKPRFTARRMAAGRTRHGPRHTPSDTQQPRSKLRGRRVSPRTGPGVIVRCAGVGSPSGAKPEVR